MKASVIKTLDYLGGHDTTRLIVAGKYLQDGRAAFVDRKNSVLLITNTSDETILEVDLLAPLRNQVSQKEAISPSDVNKGFGDDQLLITYTGVDFSIGMICNTSFTQHQANIKVTGTVRTMDRTRSIVVLDENHYCATTEYRVLVLNKSGDCVAEEPRFKRDRGGLLMSDKTRRFFYGDGDEFVGCQWDGINITLLFRFTHPKMKFPRGSAIDASGYIVVCCDSSNNIFQITPDGKHGESFAFRGMKGFGDIDFHPNGKFFFTTFWKENQWPVLFKVEA